MGEIQIKSGNLCERYTSVGTAQQYSVSLYMFTDIQPSTTYTIAFEIDEGSLQYFNENLFTYSQYYVTGTGNKQILQLNTKANIQKTASTWSDTYGWIIAKNYTGNATVPHWKKIQLLEGTYTSETIPQYQPYFLNRPAHRYTNGQWVDIPTHHFTNGRWQGELTSQSPLKFWADGEMLDWRVEGKTSENLYPIEMKDDAWTAFRGGKIISRSDNVLQVLTTDSEQTSGIYTNPLSSALRQLSALSDIVSMSADICCDNPNAKLSIGFETEGKLLYLTQITSEFQHYEVTNFTFSKEQTFVVYCANKQTANIYIKNLMINLGSTAPPYEPYGGVGDWDETEQKYRIPVTVNGVTTNLYADHQLMDGDSIDYATTETQIPLATGNNVLTVDTAVQPKNVFVKFEG